MSNKVQIPGNGRAVAKLVQLFQAASLNDSWPSGSTGRLVRSEREFDPHRSRHKMQKVTHTILAPKHWLE